MAHPVVQILNVGDIAELVRADRTDGQLLDLFVQKRDQEAFATLVRRHGGLVLGVCRRVLRNHADADDAFQAAFLVLARKAGTLGPRGLLAKWLHGVAYNTARKLRRTNGRRAAREQPLANAPEPIASDRIELREELLAILDEELCKLPERYRVPIVLCDLEGATRKEAARLIGCPEGTVAGRLARARTLLAVRLASRGIAPSTGILAAILTQRSASAVTPALVAGVLRIIGGAVSHRVACLAEGVVTAMFINKLKTAAIAVFVCGLAVAGLASAFRADATAGTEPLAPPVEQNDPKKPDGEAKLLTVIPLRKLEAEPTAKVIADAYKGKGVTVAAIPDERSLLLYADERATREVEELLFKLGEKTEGKKPSIIRLKDAKCIETAKMLQEIFNPLKPGTGSSRVTIVPVPEENALIVYASPIDTLTIRSLLRKEIDAVGEVAQPKPAAVPIPEKTFTINFRNVAWKDVIEWYAKESGFTLIGDRFPTGTVTLQPPKDRKFTIGEITDLLNEALTQQKFIIIRRSKTFIVHPADEKVDPTFIPRIELSELTSRGKTELVEVEITLVKDWDAADLATEIRKMLTPFGEVAFAKGKRLVLRDTAVNLKRICSAASTPGGEYIEGFDPRKGAGAIRPPSPLLPITPMTQSTPFRTMPFWMKEVPWSEALEWYSKATGLTPMVTVKLAGWFTPPSADREYSISEITDIINESLAAQKLILVRRSVTFIILSTNEKIDGSLIPQIELDQLSTRGNTELVQVLIPLKSLLVEDAAPEIQKLLTPLGQVSKLNRSNTLVVLDTVGRVRRIYETIQEVEKSSENESLTHICKYRVAQDIAETLKTLLADSRVKSMVITVNERANAVTITAPAEKIKLAKRIIEDTDKPKNPGDKPIRLPDPEIRRYAVPPGTAEAVAKVLQSDMPSIRVMALPMSNEVMVYATPEEHLKLSWLKEFGPKVVAKKTELISIPFGDPKEYAAKLQQLFPKSVLGPDIRPCFWGLPAIIVTGTAEQIETAKALFEVIQDLNRKK